MYKFKAAIEEYIEATKICLLHSFLGLFQEGQGLYYKGLITVLEKVYNLIETDPKSIAQAKRMIEAYEKRNEHLLNFNVEKRVYKTRIECEIIDVDVKTGTYLNVKNNTIYTSETNKGRLKLIMFDIAKKCYSDIPTNIIQKYKFSCYDIQDVYTKELFTCWCNSERLKRGLVCN